MSGDTKKGDRSRVVDAAVKWRALDRTIDEARGTFADMPADQLESLIEEAVTSVRKAAASKAS